MEDKTEKKENHSLEENLEAVGQIIIGSIESLGGIITGDPLTRAEGDFNTGMGAAHQQSNRILTAIENEEDNEIERT